MGLLPAAAGSVHLNGRDITHASPRDRLRAGVGYIPEDRQEDGLVTEFSVADNMILDVYDRPPYAAGLSMKLDDIRRAAEQKVAAFDVRTTSTLTPTGTLSGGNQQKVILAREIGREVRLLLASQPTRGLDVGSIEFVHRRIVEQRDQGVAVVIVSSELDEIYALADRIAVMYEGRITGFRPPTAPAEELGLLMAGAESGDGVPGHDMLEVAEVDPAEVAAAAPAPATVEPGTGDPGAAPEAETTPPTAPGEPS